MKKVLLINPKRTAENTSSPFPHLGLTILATILKNNGLSPLVLDYSFNHDAPNVRHFVRELDPDVVGVTMWTSCVDVANEVIDKVIEVKKVPIVIGGPHATLYYQDLSGDTRMSYIVTGEAEDIVVDVMRDAEIQQKPVIVRSSTPDINKLPFPDFRLCYNYQKMTTKPIQMSRGCPFNCSFCEVSTLSSKKVRVRDVEACIEEIRQAKEILPNLRQIRIVDDAPTVQIKRFIEFLKMYIGANIGLGIYIDNMRADGISEELLDLLKQCGVSHICLGVESANPEVFNAVDKGETLEEIEQGATLVKKKGIPLELCFVLGLPYATYEKDLDSIKLARRLKPDWVYWNMFVPYRGTRARKWFEEHGRLFGEEGFSSLIDYNLDMDNPAVETDDYTLWERKRAWIKANLQTGTFHFRLSLMPKIIRYVIQYHLYSDFFVMLTTQTVRKYVRNRLKYFVRGIPGARYLYGGLHVAWKRLVVRAIASR